jgi:hypothetical protein
MHKVIRIVCLLAVLGGAVFAQDMRAPSSNGSPQDALLAEVRALRVEVHRINSVNIRAQLLVARLQLQEQRVYTTARQLADAQGALARVQDRLSGERARVRQLEDAASRATGQSRLAFQQAMADAGSQIEHQRREEQQLQARESELLRAVSDAQSRWTNFNTLLDDLERSLSPEFEGR